jgi:hypothetical protein
LHSEVKSGKWLILFQNMMDSGMGTSAQTEPFYGSGHCKWQWRALSLRGEADKVAAATSVTQRQVFTSVVELCEARKKVQLGA